MRQHLAIGCGAALGALLRYLTHIMVVSTGLAGLWTTGLVNVLGSFAIVLYGTVTGPGGRLGSDLSTRLFVMAGLCGGYTTFSALSLDAVLMAETGHYAGAAGFLAAVVGLSLAAAWAGRAVGRWVNG
ncbi:fluoride efflux transporter FluC [Phreatobacter sp.]|uniref:fluoride efflux transporter FluC n=1 Tax=Phreatobacter sp. TaxID=1966341 RepID=UPI003F718B9D